MNKMMSKKWSTDCTGVKELFLKWEIEVWDKRKSKLLDVAHLIHMSFRKRWKSTTGICENDGDDGNTKLH